MSSDSKMPPVGTIVWMRTECSRPARAKVLGFDGKGCVALQFDEASRFHHPGKPCRYLYRPAFLSAVESVGEKRRRVS